MSAETVPADLLSRIIAEDLIARSSSQPVYLSSIEVVGGEVFSREFFAKLLSPLVSTGDYTLAQLLGNIDSSRTRLLKTDVFKSVDVSLHADYSTAPKIRSYNKEKSIPTKVVFDLQSLNLNGGQSFFSVNNDDYLNVKLNYLNNNFNENAELVNIGVDYNPYKPNEHLLANGRFIANLNNPAFKFIIDLYNTHQNNQSWQQNLEKLLGGLIGVQYINDTKIWSVLNGVALSKKSIHDIGDGASESLKSFAGDYLKSSIVNQVIFSRLKYLNTITSNFPTSGVHAALSNELSSSQEHDNPNNKALFFKTSVSASWYKSLANNTITAHVAADAGLVHQPQSSTAAIHISDKFYLGGFNTLRGFSRNSVNKNGGLQFYKFGVTLYGKLPSFIYSPHKISAVNTAALEDGRGYEANPLRLYFSGAAANVDDNAFTSQSGVTSMGFGLRYFNHWANIDVGYFLASRFGSADVGGIKDGFQFGVSIGGSNL